MQTIHILYLKQPINVGVLYKMKMVEFILLPKQEITTEFLGCYRGLNGQIFREWGAML